MITQKEIAAKLGLSTQSVRFALSPDTAKQKQIGPGTRRRVLETVEQLGYVPNRAARCLVHGKTYTIMLATHMSLRYYEASEFVEELEMALTTHGYHLNLALLYAQDEEAIYRTFSAGHCDGVVRYDLNYFARDYERLIAIRKRGLPVVVVDVDQRPGVDSVRGDVTEQARLLTAHLLERGHRRIAYVVDAVDCVLRQRRLAGYRRALAEAGVPYDEALVFPWRTDVNPSGLWARIAALSPRPAAIHCYNPELAVALLMAMRKHGVRMPEDIAMATLGDMPLLALLDVPLTSTDSTNRAAAAAVTERLLAQMANPEAPPQQILIKPSLIERESSRSRGGRQSVGSVPGSGKTGSGQQL